MLAQSSSSSSTPLLSLPEHIQQLKQIFKDWQTKSSDYRLKHSEHSPLSQIMNDTKLYNFLSTDESNLLNQILDDEINLELASDQGISQLLLLALILLEEGRSRLNPELIAQITQESFNQIVTSGIYAGESPLFWLTATAEGRAILDKHPELIAQITEAGLNQVIQSGENAGYSPLFWLTATDEGQAILDKHPELTSKITQKSLNQVIPSGEFAGKSPLYWLTATPKGLSLLNKHPELIAKITQEGLNQVIQSGEFAGYSPLYMLTRNSQGLSLLDKHPELIANITKEGLNQIVTSGEDAGHSPLFWLTATAEGQAILDKHPELTSKITQKSLNQIVTSGEYAGYSPLYWLTATPKGRTILDKHSKLIAQITEEGLNQIVTSGENAGHSPLFWLIASAEGQAILDKHPELTSKITQKSLNQVIQSGEYAGYSPLFWLTATSREMSLLDKYPKLIAQITEEGLNQVIPSGEFAGKSPLYWLTATPKGLSLLDKHPELTAKITQEGLNQIVTSGENAGHSPLFWLTATTERQAILDKYPELIAQITKEGLNQIVTSGEFAGYSPLYWLTATPEGPAILDKHPELIAQITKEGLNQIVTSGEQAGHSPLFWLTGKPEGRAILDKHPELTAKITQKSLNQVIQSGAYAGFSPLYWLARHSKGQAILDKHPELIAQITQEGFNQVIQSGEQAGHSPLFWLSSTAKGVSLLDKHSKLIAQITQEGLNQIVTSGKQAGFSPLFWLTRNSEGQVILDKYPKLIAQITQEGLNQLVTSGEDARQSPLYWLTANPEGQAILDKYPKLIAQITKESLNQVIPSGEQAGRSPLFWLTGKPEGRAILDKHSKLIAQITQEGLNQIVTSGAYAGHSPLLWLTANFEGRVILDKHPELISNITKKSLNQVIQSGEYAGKSPLFWLTATPEGQAILDKHPELISNITKKSLNQIVTSGEDAGQSPLFWLTANTEGLAILVKRPELIAKITEAGLNQVIQSGEQAGKSPLFWLTAHSKGRVILGKHPELIAKITSEAAKLQVFKAFQQHRNEECSGYGLAYCHEKGIGCPLDKAQALLLYLKAADAGMLEAKLACARLYEEKRQFDEAIAVYQALFQDEKFSDLSSAQRAQILWMTLKLKMDANIAAGVYQLFKASAPTDPKGWLGLGQCYLYGIGTPANFNQAKRCFQTASEYEATNGQAQEYLKVLNQHNNIAKYYCDELADKLSVLGIEEAGSPNDGFYQFRLSADFMNQLVGTADKAKIGQLKMDQAALFRLSGILLASQDGQAYPSLIAVFKKAYSTQQRNLKIEAVMALKNRRLEITEQFTKADEELRKLLRDNMPQVYRAWNEANQINHDLSSGEGNSSALKKNAGFFNFFTSLKNKFRDHEQALQGNRDQYSDHYLAFHQRYIKRNNLNKAIAAYQADDFENGDILLDEAQGQALLAAMKQALENVQKMISDLKPSLDGFQSKHKDFERFAGHYRYQRPVDTSGNLSETVTIPAYLEYIQAAESEYARSEAAQKALPPVLEEKQEEVESQESPEPFEAVSLAIQAEPMLLSDEKLRVLLQAPSAVRTSASSAVNSSGSYYFSYSNFGEKAFSIRFTLEWSRCVKAVSSLGAENSQEDRTALTYGLLYELGEILERLKNLKSKQFYYPCAAQLRNVLYHGKKLAQIKQPHLYFNDYLELAQKLAAYLEKVAASPQVFDTQELMAKIPCGLFNSLLNYSLGQEQLTPEEIIELISELNNQENLIQSSKLTEEYQENAGKFIIGRRGALLADLKHQFPHAYQLYFADNPNVKTDRELGKEFRHGL